MIGASKVLAVIPARGGSKGIPGKNLRDLGGKPLIAWAIEAALASATVDRVVASTDDPDIAEAARRWGAEVPFMRPAELARDQTPGDAPFRHAVEQLPGYDLAVLLQPTSPLRNSDDIDGCVRLAQASGKPVVSVCESDKHPAWMYMLNGAAPIPLLPELAGAERRQDLPPVYVLNGAVYVIQAGALLAGEPLLGESISAFVMPRTRSIDIDDELDLRLARAILEGARA